MLKKIQNQSKVITGPNTVFNYLYCWEPKALTENATPKYSVSLIIKKSDIRTIEKIKKAIEYAYKKGESTLKGNCKSVPALSMLKIPLRDGDAERPEDETYKGCYFVNAKSIQAPGIVDENCNPILERNKMYSGVIGRASITFYAFNFNGNKGIACSLNNLQKLADGTRLGIKASAKRDFGTSDVEDFSD